MNPVGGPNLKRSILATRPPARRPWWESYMVEAVAIVVIWTAVLGALALILLR